MAIGIRFTSVQEVLSLEGDGERAFGAAPFTDFELYPIGLALSRGPCAKDGRPLAPPPYFSSLFHNFGGPHIRNKAGYRANT